MEIALESLEGKEREMEGRIEKLEKIEKTLITRMQRIERRLGLKSEKMGSRKDEVSLREIISEEMKAIRKTVPKIGLGERRGMLKKEMKNILKEYESAGKEKDGVGKKDKGGKERKILLRKEIEEIVSSKGAKEERKKQPLKEIKEIDISTDQDARLLFKIVLKRGSVKLDEAKEKLGVDEKTLQEWVEDLKGAGVIEVVKTPYGQVVRLKVTGVEREDKEEL